MEELGFSPKWVSFGVHALNHYAMGREQRVSDDLCFKTRVGGPVLEGESWWAVQEPALSPPQSSL